MLTRKKKDRAQEPQELVFVRINPDNPHLAHLAKTARGETFCKLKPDNTVAVLTDSKSLNQDNICQNCNGVVRKRVRRETLKI